MKKYKLILLDKKNNELTHLFYSAKNKNDVIQYKKLIQATFQINDLKKIIIKKH